MSNLRTLFTVFVLFFLLCKIVCVLNVEKKFPENLNIVLAGVIFTLVLSRITCIKDMFMFEVTPAKTCLGGAYLHQGDSPNSLFCQKLAKDHPEQIADYQCNKWMNNMPLQRGVMDYTPESDSLWQNPRCGPAALPKPNTCNVSTECVNN